MNRTFVLSSFVFLLCVSCLTVIQEPIIVQPLDIILDRIEQSYRNNNPGYGLTLIEGAMQRFPEQQWEEKREAGIALMKQAYSEASEKESWEELITLHKSLQALGETAFLDDLTLESITKLYLESLVYDKNPVLGLSLLADRFSAFSFSNEEYMMLESIAEREMHRVSLNMIREKIEPGSVVSSPLSPEIARSFLKGMATIWVDRGIRLDQGFGVPDRVIGSGFFIDSRGYLLTNYHVISSEVDPEYEGYSRLYIRLPDSPRERLPARVVGWDTLLDLALLKVEYTPGYVFSFTEKELGPGQQIYAIGSPGGLESTITSGIVSAIDRRLLQIGDTVQIDVPINAGNSGGPLIDPFGNVVGVVFAGIEFFEGVNFAIPAKWVNLVIDQLYDHKAVDHPWLGVAVYETRGGLEVLYVFPDSPAHLSGIREGDIITGIANYSGQKIGEYQFELLHHKKDQVVAVALIRDDAEITIMSQFGARPESPFLEALKKDNPNSFIYPLFGFSLEYAGSTLWERRFRVSRILNGMPADESGLSTNDPLVVKSFKIESKSRIAILHLNVKKRKAGFLESSLMMGAHIDGDYFL